MYFVMCTAHQNKLHTAIGLLGCVRMSACACVYVLGFVLIMCICHVC